jgi:hypothetical protein
METNNIDIYGQWKTIAKSGGNYLALTPVDVIEVGHRNCPKHLRLSKHTDMTIRWKALEEHFLVVVALVAFQFTRFQGK